MKINHQKTSEEKRKARVRRRVRGTTERPRVTVFRSNRYTYVQVIDDSVGKTIAAVSSAIAAKAATANDAKSGTKMEEARKAAEVLAEKLKKAKVTKVVFDRGSYKYHGRVKAVAEVMREHGMEV